MNVRERNDLIAAGESERVEFKRTTGQRSEAAKTVCANRVRAYLRAHHMLNGLGGFVLFGVTDSGEAAGQQVTAKTFEDIAGECRRIGPPAFPDNALCHRDYTIPGGAVAVAMYDDHLEIVTPGALHFGITPEKLTQPHESKPWNPIVANVFYRAGVIERWGSGTINITDWCVENGNPPPRWPEQAGSVYATFSPSVLPDAQRPTWKARLRPETATQSPTQLVYMIEAHDEAHVEAHEQAYDEAHDQVSDTEQTILNACADEPRKASELLTLLGYGDSVRHGRVSRMALRPSG